MANCTLQKPMRELEEKIGYTFKNKEILIEALTHSSYSNEMKSKGEKIAFNERLEFLGDSVLSIVVSSYIFEKYRSKQEGDLTKIRAAVVCEKALSKFAGEIELGDYMFLGHGEIMNNGRRRPSITADAFEALLAAIYLDTGETFSVVEKFLLPFIAKEIDYISASGVFIDYKTALQQIVQQAQLGRNLGTANDRCQRAGRCVQHLVKGSQFCSHQRAGTGHSGLPYRPFGRGMRPVGCAKGVHHINITKPGQLCCQGGVVLFFALEKANVFQQRALTSLKPGSLHCGHILVDGYIKAQQTAKVGSHWLERELFLVLPFGGATQMGQHQHGSPLVQCHPNGRQGGTDALIIGDAPFLHGHVEIFADDDGLARAIHISKQSDRHG